MTARLVPWMPVDSLRQLLDDCCYEGCPDAPYSVRFGRDFVVVLCERHHPEWNA